MTQPSIPFFNYPSLFRDEESELAPLVMDVLRRGAYIMQRDLEEFEQALADYLGVKHAIGVADGTLALKFGLHAIGIGPGDEVIVPTHTFIASAAAIHWTGATPVLCDIGRDHLIDAESARNKITSRTRAIMPVQLNGRTANMDPIMALAAQHGLEIVEDSCQALGSKFKGQPAGTFGAAGAFSFYPSKTLGAFGDAGAVVTNSDEVAAQIRLFRDHGRGADGIVRSWGLNGRLDNLQAAVLHQRLKRYDSMVARRREIAARYEAQLNHLETLLLPPAPNADPDHFDIYQNYEIEADRRDELRAHLTERGVGTIVQWGGHVIHQFKDLGFTETLPRAEAMTGRFMMLPMNLSVSDNDVDYICDAICAFYGSKGR